MMTKQEFIDTLGAKLHEELPGAEVLSQIRYYQGYIDGETAKGKDEEDVTAELGDPLLIAKTILDAAREERIPENTFEDGETSYYEGAFEAEYETENAVRKEPWAGAGPFRDPEEPSDNETEEASYRNEAEEAPYQDESYEDQYQDESYEERYRDEPYEDPYRDETEETDEDNRENEDTAPRAGSPAGEAGSGAGWDFFALILAGVMLIVAVIWIVTKVIFIAGPVILVILAAILIIRTIYDMRTKS